MKKLTYAFDYKLSVRRAAEALGARVHVFAKGKEGEMLIRCTPDIERRIEAETGESPNWDSRKKIGKLLEQGGEFTDDEAGLADYVARVCADEARAA